jgi:hypothetical protein
MGSGCAQGHAQGGSGGHLREIHPCTILSVGQYVGLCQIIGRPPHPDDTHVNLSSRRPDLEAAVDAWIAREIKRQCLRGDILHLPALLDLRIQAEALCVAREQQ